VGLGSVSTGSSAEKSATDYKGPILDDEKGLSGEALHAMTSPGSSLPDTRLPADAELSLDRRIGTPHFDLLTMY